MSSSFVISTSPSMKARSPPSWVKDYDSSRIWEPRLLVYQPRVKDCAKMLADVLVRNEACDQIFGESITMALLASALAFAKKSRSREQVNGLLPWQLKL